jgi:hypothetical protein
VAHTCRTSRVRVEKDGNLNGAGVRRAWLLAATQGNSSVRRRGASCEGDRGKRGWKGRRRGSRGRGIRWSFLRLGDLGLVCRLALLQSKLQGWLSEFPISDAGSISKRRGHGRHLHRACPHRRRRRTGSGDCEDVGQAAAAFYNFVLLLGRRPCQRPPTWSTVYASAPLSHGPPAGRQPERMPRRGQLGSGSLLDAGACGECNAQGDTRPENQWQSLCYVLDGGQTGPFICCASSSSYCPAGRPRGRQATALGAIRRQCRTLEQGDV